MVSSRFSGPNAARAAAKAHRRTAADISGGLVTGFAEVSDTLWRERELLDILFFKLETERLLLAAGKARWLSRATREVELVLEQLRLTELTRAIEVDALAVELYLPPNSSLSALAGVAPSPWAELFSAHRTAFRALINEITELAAANRVALDQACEASERTLLALGAGELAGYAIPRQLHGLGRLVR
jgi:FlgN protein